MAVTEEYRRGRHRALAEPDMDGHARHHRARARRGGRERHAWLAPLAALLSTVALLLGVVLLDAGGGPVVAVADGADRGDAVLVPPVSLPLPTAPEPGAAEKLANAPAKDADPADDPEAAASGGRRPGGAAGGVGEAVGVDAAAEAVRPPVAAHPVDPPAALPLPPVDPGAAPAPAPAPPAPAPPAVAPPAVDAPPEVPRAELAPAARAPVVPKPPAGARCSTVLGTANVLGYVAQAGHHVAQHFRFPLSQILGRGSRSVAGSDHPAGRALDFLVFGNRALGDAIADYALAHRGELGISYVIWQQRINTGSGWRAMPDRGSPTANHRDHVHLSFGTAPGSGLSC